MQVSKEAQTNWLCISLNYFIKFEIRDSNYKVKVDPKKVTIAKSCKYFINKRSYQVSCLSRRSVKV